MKDRNERMRQLVDLAVTSGRKRQSSQTGFVHYFHSGQEDEPHLPIPIVENLLFSLALFKSRTMENVAEAKEILDRILYFQNTQHGEMGDGNFPIYIHDFPVCKERFASVHTAQVLYLILKQFHQILGVPLRKRVEDALKSSVKHALRSLAEKPAPYSITLKIAATTKASGVFLQELELEQAGDALLIQLQSAPDRASWMCPASLGTMLLALTTVYPSLSDSPWADFWTYLGNTWHRLTGSYAGPALKEWQMTSEPQATIYDLHMGFLSEEYSARALKESPMHLEAALIPFTEDRLPEPVYPLSLKGTLGNATWTLYHDKHIAYSMLQKDVTMIQPATEKGYHLLKMLWGDLQRVHTFVYPGISNQHVLYEHTPQGFNLHIELGTPPDADEEREKTREIAFYGDLHEGLNLAISDDKATTFQIDDEIVFWSKDLRLGLNFSLEDGSGRFIGHHMFNNRPSQIGAKGIHRYETYDWTIFLRTLQRTKDCKIKVAITMDEHSRG